MSKETPVRERKPRAPKAEEAVEAKVEAKVEEQATEAVEVKAEEAK